MIPKLNFNSTFTDAAMELARIGGASLKFSVKDVKENPLAVFFLVRGREESAAAAAAFDACEKVWQGDALGCSHLVWINATKELPDDDVCVLICLVDEDGLMGEDAMWDHGYHSDGKWWYDTAPEEVPAEANVYAWAHIPKLPPQRKGGAK